MWRLVISPCVCVCVRDCVVVIAHSSVVGGADVGLVAGIQVPLDRIFGLGTGPKAGVLADLLAKHRWAVAAVK